jgi:hypothetical protein
LSRFKACIDTKEVTLRGNTYDLLRSDIDLVKHR